MIIIVSLNICIVFPSKDVDQGQVLPIWSGSPSIFILQSQLDLLYGFFGTWRKAQEVEIDITDYQVLPDGFDDRRPASAEKYKWSGAFLCLVCGPDHGQL